MRRERDGHPVLAVLCLLQGQGTGRPLEASMTLYPLCLYPSSCAPTSPENFPGRGHETLSRDDPKTGVSTWALHTRPWKAYQGVFLISGVPWLARSRAVTAAETCLHVGSHNCWGAEVCSKRTARKSSGTRTAVGSLVTSVISQHVLLIQPVDPKEQ